MDNDKGVLCVVCSVKKRDAIAMVVIANVNVAL
jgi:hypothetical protein